MTLSLMLEEIGRLMFLTKYRILKILIGESGAYYIIVVNIIKILDIFLGYI